jgi:hypothetical protein
MVYEAQINAWFTLSQAPNLEGTWKTVLNLVQVASRNLSFPNLTEIA